MLRNLALVALSAALLEPGAAFAADAGTARFSLDIAGTVPVICRAHVAPNIVRRGDGTVGLGRLIEFCNDPNGYEVHAEHSGELAGAVLVIDGVELPLSASGSTRIVKAATAGVASRNIELRLPTGRAGGTLSLRVVPL